MIIADASHSLGATRDGETVGRMADMSILSLHPAKILTTGEGGAVLTDSDEYAGRLRRFRNHGISSELRARRDWTYAMVELGYNYRLTDIGAALGTSQLSRLETWLGATPPARRPLPGAARGHELLDLPVVEPGADPAWHFLFAQLRLDRLRWTAA